MALTDGRLPELGAIPALPTLSDEDEDADDPGTAGLLPPLIRAPLVPAPGMATLVPEEGLTGWGAAITLPYGACLLYTSDAADE